MWVAWRVWTRRAAVYWGKIGFDSHPLTLVGPPFQTPSSLATWKSVVLYLGGKSQALSFEGSYGVDKGKIDSYEVAVIR